MEGDTSETHVKDNDHQEEGGGAGTMEVKSMVERLNRIGYVLLRASGALRSFWEFFYQKVLKISIGVRNLKPVIFPENSGMANLA